MNLEAWAARWNVPAAAVDELCRSCIFDPDRSVEPKKSEARVQSEVRLEAAANDTYLFRNNVGAGKLDNGKFIRWGLANDSEKVNDVIKSADLIGIKKTLITVDMVGSYIGKFISRETKPNDWKFSGSLHEHAQLRWATLINAQGGDAKVVTGLGSFKTL